MSIPDSAGCILAVVALLSMTLAFPSFAASWAAQVNALHPLLPRAGLPPADGSGSQPPSENIPPADQVAPYIEIDLMPFVMPHLPVDRNL